MIVEISERMSSEVNFGATVTTPTGFDPEKESLPMIVFLHGAGERGEDLSIVNKVGLPKYFTADPDYKGLRDHNPVAAVSWIIPYGTTCRFSCFSLS